MAAEPSPYRPPAADCLGEVPARPKFTRSDWVFALFFLSGGPLLAGLGVNGFISWFWLD